MSAPKAPEGLGAPGRKLWRDVLARYDLDPAELALLELACQARDDAASAREALGRDGVVAQGRYGQPTAHPGVTIARQAETNVARILGQLGVIDRVEKPARDASTPGPKPRRRR